MSIANVTSSFPADTVIVLRQSGEHLYTTVQVADRLACSQQRVRQLVKDGRLVPVSTHKPYLFTQAAIDACKAVWPGPVGRPVGK